jgi:TolB-like protein/Flp pilus assembly protein TadD
MVEVRAMLQRCSSPPLEPHDREKPSIAVLPFENLSPDKENEYFGDGLAEEILNGLTRVPGLRVIARTSAFAFRARGITVQEIGARLKVGTVLEGSVRKAGNRIRVTVQLIRVMDESHLWSERYDRDLIDIFALQDEISQAIVEALKIKLTGPPRSLAADRYTENVEAYNLYLKGRFHLYKMTGDEVAAGLKLMEQAVAIDPDYAPAHVELAHHELMLAFAGVTAPPTFIPRCKAALSRIVARFDECAEAHAVLGLLLGVCEYRWEEAGRELGRARELNPASPLAHTLTATLLAGQNRLDEALLYSRRAVDLDPLSPFFNHALSILLAFAKQPAPAIEYGRAALEVQPDSWLAFSSLGGAYGAAGRWDEAVDWLEKARAHAPVENWVSGWLASAYMHVGRRAKAEQILAGLTLRRQGTYVSATALGMACAALGDVAGAFTWLEKAMSESDPILYFLKIDPVFDGLRSHARYRELLRAMNL